MIQRKSPCVYMGPCDWFISSLMFIQIWKYIIIIIYMGLMHFELNIIQEKLSRLFTQVFFALLYLYIFLIFWMGCGVWGSFVN
jgi:hypothetical protein